MRKQVNFFVLGLSHSGAGLVQAFGHATQQAFLEGHVEAFAFLGAFPPASATTTSPRRSSSP